MTDQPTFTADEVGKTCLVTGGAGYVGTTIVHRLLEAGCTVKSFDVLDHQHTGDVECISGDLCNYEAVRKAMEGVDTVFHTAAVISTLEMFRKKRRDFVWNINVGGTNNVINAAADAGTKAMVHTSSFIVVLDRHGLDNKDESLPYATRNKDLYTITKVESEKIVLAANGKNGLKTCALRPGGIWGPNPHCIMINGILKEVAKNNFKVLIGSPKITMDNTHVENLVDAQLLAAKSLHSSTAQAAGQAYFITDDEALNPLEWFRPLVEGLGEKFPKVWLPGMLMRGVGRMLEVSHMLGAPEPTLTRRAMRNLTESSSFKIDKARRDIGYEPRYRRENGIPELLPAARDYLRAARNKLPV